LAWLFIIIGAFLPIMSFEFKGVAGLAIAFISADLQRVTHSTMSICTSLLDIGVQDATTVMAVVFLQICFIMFTFILPLLILIMLGGMWTVPLTLQEQKLFFFACEVIYCWEALLVFIVSVLAAILQISVLAQFIVKHATGSLCTILEAPLKKIFAAENAKCFDVTASLEPTGAIIIVGAVLAMAVTMVAFRLIHAALEDRELAMKRKHPHSPGQMTGLYGFVVRQSLEAFGGTGNAAQKLEQMQQPNGQQGYGGGQISPYGMATPSMGFGQVGQQSTPSMGYGTPSMGGYGGQSQQPSVSRMTAQNPMYGGQPSVSRTHASIDV
jgi:hypothetical protein